MYLAVDRNGKTIYSLLSEGLDEAVATPFFALAIRINGWPEMVLIDKSGANLAVLGNLNWLPILQGWSWLIYICQVKFRNDVNEQVHRFIKKLTR